MITKGRIIAKSNDNNKFKVELPIFASPGLNINSNLNSTILDATICHQPGISPSYKKDDIVYVGFEDNDLSRPIILGLLYLPDKENLSDIKSSALKTLGVTQLSKSTSIGNISYDDFIKLFGKVNFIYNILVENKIIESEEN